ncbi:hypothetical protein GCM10023081_00410 [Arthrobacter ginkgonis]|uniref:Uncharacterized protein n=1 Tax=Arthrobacter ginkgonis TaxID=1630594 RepID=A0ABP7BQ30_9MICC
MNTKNRRSRKRESGMSYFVFGVVLLCATLAFVLFGRLEAPWQAFAALAAGTALGIWLFRFGSRHAWVSLLCLFGALAVCVVLFMNADTVGSAGIAWIGAFVAGTNLGAAWRLAATKPTASAARAAKGAEAAWEVDGQEFASVAEARKVASAALRALDGNASAHVYVEHGSARFEVAGSAGTGLVCHRNPDVSKEASWAALVRTDQAADNSVEVPMGDLKGSMPSRVVHDLPSAEAALSDFFKTPESTPSGPEWLTGNEALGTRLTIF